MELRQDNFADLHNVVEAALRRCEYFSVDLEFTGIDSDPASSAVPEAADEGEVKDSPNHGEVSEEDAMAQAACKSLLTLPEDVYARKKAAIDSYTVMQIGISTFERVTTPSDVNGGTPHTEKVTDKRKAAMAVVTAYMRESSKTLVDVFSLGEGSRTSRTQALIDRLLGDCAVVADLGRGHIADTVVKDVCDHLSKSFGVFCTTATELADAQGHERRSKTTSSGRNDMKSGESGDLATAPSTVTVEALREADCVQQLMALYRQWLRDIPSLYESALLKQQSEEERERRAMGDSNARVGHDASSGLFLHHRAPVYEVQTFYAYLFPSSASSTFRDTAMNSETVGVFLLKNNLDCGKWVSDGLRFTTLAEYTQSRMASLRKQSQWMTTSASTLSESVEGYADTYAHQLDGLFPLTSAEMSYVRFVVQQQDPQLRRSLADCTKALFLYARAAYGSGACPSGEKAARLPPPPSVFITNRNTNAEEARILKSMGMRKAGKCFQLDSSFTVSADEGFTDVHGIRGTMHSGGFVDPSSSPERLYYGSRLIATLLTAAQVWGKPLVVHNGYSDLCFLIRTIFGVLPDTYRDFKKVCRETFPTFYDSRTLTTCPALQHLGYTHGRLEKTFEEVEKKAGRSKALLDGLAVGKPFDWALGEGTRPTFCVNPAHAGFMGAITKSESGGGGGGSGGGLQAHNAGFDAYITGLMFAYAKEELLVAALVKGPKSGAAITEASVLRPYEGICPVHGSLFSVHFNDTEHDTILVPPESPIVLLYGKAVFRFGEAIREAGESVNLKLSVMPASSGYVAFVCNTDMSPETAGQRLVNMMDHVRRDCNTGPQQLKMIYIAYNDFLPTKKTATKGGVANRIVYHTDK